MITRRTASTVHEYLCLLWDNVTSAEHVTPIERRAEKLELITIRVQKSASTAFGGLWHVRQITDEGKKARDAHVAIVAASLSATVRDALETCHNQPFDGSLSHRSLINKGFAHRANAGREAAVVTPAHDLTGRRVLVRRGDHAGPTNDTMRLTPFGRAVHDHRPEMIP